MDQFNDKFNIIQINLNTLPNDNTKLILNFLENYLLSDIYIIHPNYFYNLYWQKQNIPSNLNICINNYIKSYLKEIRTNIRNMIKKHKYDIKNGLNKLLKSYIKKINKIKNIFDFNVLDGFNEFHNLIISDATIITFLENELNTYDINEIKKLIKYIFIINENNNLNIIWFLKTLSSIIRTPILNISITLPIPSNYILLYELNEIIDYYQKINKYYNFLNENLIYIINPIIEILIEKFNNMILHCSLTQITTLLENKWDYIYDNIKNIKNYYILKNNITKHLNNYIFANNMDNYSINETITFLKLIIILNKYSLIENYILLLLNNNNIINNIHIIIHNSINDVEFINNILKLLISNLKEKDNFFDKYHLNLIKRLLSNNTNINIEKDYICKFNNTLIYKYKNKIDKVINDVETSKNDLQNFYNLENIINNNKLYLITTSYSNWNLNYNQGLLNQDIINELQETSSLCKLLNNYNLYYQSQYNNNRKLIWLPQYGEINITYEQDTDKFVDIILLPIQFIILELFDYQTEISINEIKNKKFFENYTTKFKDDIIRSLIINKIVVLNNDLLKLSKTNTILPNFINTFLQQSNFLEDEEENRINELSLSRNDIISSLVNHIIKIDSKNFSDLLILINNKLTIFKVNETMLLNVINNMIVMDYIKYDENTKKYSKIFY